MATQTDYAWAAGFVDADGCISLHPQRLNGYTSPIVQLIIVQKDIVGLEHFRAIFDGKEKISPVYRHKKTFMYWRLVFSTKRAAHVLQLILPYLVLKREVAQVALELQNDIDTRSPWQQGKIGRGYKAAFPPEVLAYRRSLHERAKWLNSGRWAAATTERENQEVTSGSDSLACNNGKVAVQFIFRNPECAIKRTEFI